MSKNKFVRFQRFGIVCIVVVYLLILVGGIVRSTGAGMGCPDWPTCFGKIVPPTHESELPADYQLIYKNHGYGTMKFNAVKTWTEYLNRLLGVLTGLFVLILFVASFIYKNKDKVIIQLAGLSLFLVILEGILGMLVVKMNLEGSTVSVHFWGSLAIIIVLIYLVFRTGKESLSLGVISDAKQLRTILFLIIGLTIIQIALGTQVRQELERVSIELNYSLRDSWISRLSSVFYFHRSFSIILVLAHLLFLYKVIKLSEGSNILFQTTVVLVILLTLEVFAGIILNYLHVPAMIQPIHMLLGPMILGVQCLILFVLNYSINKSGALHSVRI